MAIREYWVSPSGEKFYTLPKRWHNLTPFPASVAYAHGWSKFGEHVQEPDHTRTQCTKYELLQCLEQFFPDLLSTLKEKYAANEELQFYWNSVIRLDRTNADFQKAAQELGVTDEQLDEIFQKITAEGTAV